MAAAGLLLRLLACLQCPAQARALPALPLAQLAAEDDLQVGMQRVVDEAAAKYSISLGLGFVDGEHSFGLGDDQGSQVLLLLGFFHFHSFFSSPPHPSSPWSTKALLLLL